MERSEEEEREKKDEEEEEEREKKEDDEGEEKDIMSKLFNYDLYEALQIVFLRCLKTTAETCHHNQCHSLFQESDSFSLSFFDLTIVLIGKLNLTRQSSVWTPSP